MSRVEIRDLSKVFVRGDQQITVLDGLDLDLESSGFMALMGPSGSGKSTLLHLLAGLDAPTGGRIRVGQHEIHNMNRRQLAQWRAQNVGFVFQRFNLLPVLTAYQNVELPLLLTPLSRKKRRDHVMLALEIVGLVDRAKHRPRELSGGQEQRVAIARALVSDAPLILADEPTGNLDAGSAEEVLSILERLSSAHGKTIAMVTHDSNAADRARTVVHLEKGVLRR